MTAFCTVKNSLYKKTEGINPILTRAVDQDLYYKLEEVGEHKFIDEYLYLYRINENSISQNVNSKKAIFWHDFVRLKAYKRRKHSKEGARNLDKETYKNLQNSFYLKSIRNAVIKKNYIKKYCITIRSLWFWGAKDFKYKLKCLLIPTYL